MKLLTIASSFLRPIAAGVLLSICTSSGVFADVVVDWNVAMTAYCESLPPPANPPYINARIFAMAHIAMFDAVAEAKEIQSTPGKHHGPGNPEAAAAQAAHDVLVNQLPGGAAKFDMLLATQLAAIPNSAAKIQGIATGADAAADMLAVRLNDGASTAEGPYTPGTSPGDYQFTPPFDGPPFNGYAAVPKWGQVTPFTMKSGRQFRAPPPYKVTDLAYTFDFNEIKEMGAANSLSRTADETALAVFWSENSELGWNRIARQLDAPHPLDLLGHARLFAALNAALCDSTIASLESKYFYNFWRPITAIHAAATDGNALTTADPTYSQLPYAGPTPPVPDYPSNHSAMGGAASTVLIAFFGDESPFTLVSTVSVPFPFVGPRSFTKISDAAKENAISRMFLGIHFRLACEVGREQGIDVGTWVVTRSRFRPNH